MPVQLDVGGDDDSVRLRLGGDDLLIAESWDVREGVLDVPAAFSLTLGRSTPVKDLFTDPTTPSWDNARRLSGPKYPKGTKFELYVAGCLQMTGRVEGFHVTGAATKITLKGRDDLARLWRTHSEAQRSFLDGTYRQLVEFALTESGITDYVLRASNAANRKIKAGVPIDEIAQVITVDEINADGTSGVAGAQTTGTTIGAIVHQEHQALIRENLLHFVQRHLTRAGLFLWAAADGSFVLSQPNGAQKPIYRIIRKRGARESSNVIDCDYTDDATHRHAACSVYGRGGGRKSGRAKALGAAVDEELSNIAVGPGDYPFRGQGVLYRDVQVQNTEQAEFYARRKLAEERRAGWSLTYTVRGHRLTGINGPSTRPVVTPDTTVHVVDDELGLDDVYYVESVERLRRPETVTVVRLMRLSDLIFGTGGID